LEKTEPTGNETKTQRRFCYSCFALLRAGIYYHEGYIANQFSGGKMPRGGWKIREGG